MENCLLDIGSMVAHLRSIGYEKVVLIGNSGGASIVPYYQAQAEAPSVTDPPGGGPDLTQAGLVPADAIGMLNAHRRGRWCVPSGSTRRSSTSSSPSSVTRRSTCSRGQRPAVQRRVHRAVPGRGARAQPSHLAVGRGPAAGVVLVLALARGARRLPVRRPRHVGGPALSRRRRSTRATVRSG